MKVILLVILGLGFDAFAAKNACLWIRADDVVNASWSDSARKEHGQQLPKVFGMPNALKRFMPNGVIPSIIEDNIKGGKVILGELDDIYAISLKAGASEATIDNIGILLSNAVEGKTGLSVLEATGKALLRSRELHNLAIYALDEHASLDFNAAALHVSPRVYSNWSPQRLNQSRQDSDHQVIAALTELGIFEEAKKPKGFTELFFKPSASFDSAHKLDPLVQVKTAEGEFFHEATHFADSMFAQTWMQANIALAKQGRAVDPYFKKYTRRVGNFWLVDEGFLHFVTETRAYAVSEYVIKQFYEIDPTGLRKLIASTIVGDMLVSRGSHILEDFALPQDMLEVLKSPGVADAVLQYATGEQSLVPLMQKSIDRAKAEVNFRE